MDYVLVHHGVKGQRWGVRNGPPYPLDNANAKAHNKSGLDKKKKAIAIGAAFVATALAAYGAYKFVDSGKLRALSTKGIGFLRGDDKFPFNRDLDLSQGMSAEDIFEKVVSKINPGYKADDWGVTKNCRRCTFAYEMRRRGFDVQATKTLSGTGQNQTDLYRAQGEKRSMAGCVSSVLREIVSDAATSGKANNDPERVKDMFDSYWDGPNVVHIRNKDYKERVPSIFRSLSEMPNGSRGELAFMRYGEPGHSLAWEIINGKPCVFDCQTKSVYKSATEFTSDFPSAMIREAMLTRLDNVDLDYSFISRWIKNT